MLSCKCVYGIHCDEHELTVDSYKLCRIFSNSNINESYPNWDLSSNNYCNINKPPTIECDNDDNIVKLLLGHDYVTSCKGALQTEFEWPSYLKSIDFKEHQFSGNFSLTSLLNLNYLESIRISGEYARRNDDMDSHGHISGL